MTILELIYFLLIKNLIGRFARIFSQLLYSFAIYGGNPNKKLSMLLRGVFSSSEHLIVIGSLNLMVFILVATTIPDMLDGLNGSKYCTIFMYFEQ
ncbi:hypothetical protein PHJA_000943200 [Phtheirospermum japonicum]|uniref:Uncharacterized protein n=1 Tax=Phtheirospermum japonicum TaxID=374723 RepID=A0A830BX49_9LAMI|nr:hypothetical protein PHJA_000943200 [Phtheirospermum japonicum]